MIRLHGTALSGHVHRVDLFLRILGLDFEFAEAGGAVRASPAVPRSSIRWGRSRSSRTATSPWPTPTPSCVYLAKRYEHGGALVAQRRWSAHRGFSAGCRWPPARSPMAPARLGMAVLLWGMPGDPVRATAIAERLLGFMEAIRRAATTSQPQHPTIADLACYSYVAHAPEGRPFRWSPIPPSEPGSPASRLCRPSSRCRPRSVPGLTAMDPFHPDERRAQRLAGVEDPPSGAFIRDFMPDQHRMFFQGLPYLFAAPRTPRGWPVATVLSGAPGFIASPDEHTLRISIQETGDPVLARLTPGAGSRPARPRPLQSPAQPRQRRGGGP